MTDGGACGTASGNALPSGKSASICTCTKSGPNSWAGVGTKGWGAALTWAARAVAVADAEASHERTSRPAQAATGGPRQPGPAEGDILRASMKSGAVVLFAGAARAVGRILQASARQDRVISQDTI